MSDPNSQARNLTNSLFADLGLELPEVSAMQPHHKQHEELSVDNKKSKYGDDDGDEMWNIDLAPVSSMKPSGQKKGRKDNEVN